MGNKIHKFNEHQSGDIRQLFIDLIGEDKINFIEKRNWVEYDRNYITKEIEINFFKTDGKGDDVIFFSVIYCFDDKKWVSVNGIDNPDIAFDRISERESTYEEMRDHVKVIEGNGFQLAKLP